MSFVAIIFIPNYPYISMCIIILINPNPATIIVILNSTTTNTIITVFNFAILGLISTTIITTTIIIYVPIF